MEGMFCDVTIVYEDQQYLAHEFILAANSKYFEEVFMREDVSMCSATYEFLSTSIIHIIP